MSREGISSGEEANDGSDSVIQQDGDAKSTELATLSDATLQDLPIEVVECILLEAIAMEVKDMKLARQVWKEKTDLVIHRLGTVCLQWCSILENEFFRNQLARMLDDTAHEKIRLEILHQSPLQCYISSITTMKDEVFLLGKRGRHCHTMTVYDRNNMPEVKEVISLARLRPKSIAACSVSNCVYVLSIKRRYRCSIVRITSDGEHWSTQTPLISYLSLLVPTLCVTASGCLIISGQQTEELAPISVWDANGSLQREIRLSDDILKYVSFFWHIIPKSNGNLLLAVAHAPNRLMEIDLDGNIIRQYDFLLSCDYKCATSHADSYGRVLNIDFYQNMKLFDAEFNLVEFTGSQLGGGHLTPHDLGHNSERNELVTVVSEQGYENGFLVIFHFTEM